MTNQHNRIDAAVQRISSTGLASTDVIQGCSDVEIRDIEESLQIHLPATYVRFLKLAGKGAGSFLIGTDWMYPRVKELRSTAQWLLKESGSSYELSADAHVFTCHQDYNFLMFHCDGHDPAVWLYMEADSAPKKVFDRFTDWLSQCVSDEASLLAEVKRRELGPQE